MKRNMKKWSMELSDSVERMTMPIMTYPGLQNTGHIVRDVVTNAAYQAECIEELAKKYPSAAAMTIMDLSVEAEAFGSPVRFMDQEVPTVSSRIISDREQAEKLQIPVVGTARTFMYIEAARLSIAAIQDRPIFGGKIGPFSLAGRLMDMTEIMTMAILEPDLVHMVLDKATNFLIAYARAFKDAGANGIIIAEPAAGLLSPPMCSTFSSEYVKKIVDAVQDDYFMVILHNCGNTTKQVTSLLSTGAMGFHFGNAVSMLDILPQIPQGKIAFGNINPVSIKNDMPEEIKNKVWDLLTQTAAYNNFVLSTGCDVPPGTTLDKIDIVFQTLEQFNNAKHKQHIA